jgi:hypothetical protein
MRKVDAEVGVKASIAQVKRPVEQQLAAAAGTTWTSKGGAPGHVHDRPRTC